MFEQRQWSVRSTLQVPMRRIVPTTGFKRVFNIIFPESNPQATLKFPELLLFDTFLKIGFYTFIVPFRFHKSRKEGGRTKLQTNLIQMIISTILVTGSSIYSFLAIRLLFRMKLQDNPSEAFAVLYGMSRACFPAVWFYSFWIRRKSFNKLVMVCQTASSPSAFLASCVSSPSSILGNNFQRDTENDVNDKKIDKMKAVDWKIAIITKFCIITAASKLGIETYLFYCKCKTNSKFLDTVLGFNGGSAIYNIYQNPKDKLDNLTQAEVFSKWNQTALTFSALLFGIINNYIGNMVDAFCFVGAATMFSICYRFSCKIPKLGEKSSIDAAVLEKDKEESVKFLNLLEKLSVNYVEIGNVADASNEIFGPIFLLYILGAFPSLAGFMIFKQQSLVTGEKLGWIAMIFVVTMHIATTMIASEASSKMIDYKCWLFDVSLLRKKPTVWKTGLGTYPQPAPILSNAVLSRLNHMHREVASDSIGLKGCGFFTMTHGVIGTMLGIFVTFAIVIVQFEMEVAKKKDKDDKE